MNIKLLIGGKEIDAQISEEDAQKIQPSESRFKRARSGGKYYRIDSYGDVSPQTEVLSEFNNTCFETGNYFTSEKQAKDHIRALKLWQTIKVFRQEREGNAWKKLDYNSNDPKCFIFYSGYSGKPEWASSFDRSNMGVCYFAKGETAQAAIDEFYGELMWYFTEFEDD